MTAAGVPLPNLLDGLAGALVREFASSAVAVAVAGPEGKTAKYLYRDGTSAPAPRTPDPVTARVLRNGKSALFRNAQEWPAGARRRNGSRENMPESGIFVPIAFLGKAIGVLSLQSRERDVYDERDVEMLERCGLYLGARISDERGREETMRLQRMATTDELTSLANRRAFDEALAKEWKRCRRDKLPLSMLMLDVDYFKQYNDAYGHVAGDSCLRRVGIALGAYARRPGDLAARYGGEEFAIVLPGTDRTGAIGLAEAIRKSIVALSIAHKSSSLGFVTVSIGVETLEPKDKREAADLVRETDEQLYAAKASGRNRTVARGFEPQSTPARANVSGRAEPRLSGLPLEISAFVGREAELARAAALLEGTRLLSLVGGGGVGKTRMALRLAAGAADRFPDGVWFADFSALFDGELVPLAVLSALHVNVSAASTATATLMEFLGDKRALIILDNCEQLVAPVARLADELRRTCENVCLLATSREPLAIAGETVYRLLPMSEEEAVALFEVRASAVLPSFETAGDHEREAIVQICRGLDNVPLAIELAAARVQIMPVQQLVQRLDDRMNLLTTGGRTAQPRQKTLRGLIAWSYDILSHAEKTLFRRLCMLVSDWPIGAATAIGTGAPIAEPDVFDVLSSLVDKSLIHAETGGSEARYRLLESTRAFGIERARELGETHKLARKHADYWRDYVTATQGTWEMAQWSVAREALRRNYANIRAALSWTIAERNDVADGAEIVIALELYWSDLGPAHEGRYWYEQTLALADSLEPYLRGRLFLGAGGMALLRGDYAAMRAAAENAIAAFEAIGNRAMLARARSDMAIAHFYLGQYAEAKGEYLAVIGLFAQLGDRLRESVQIANLAELTASYEMDFAGADTWYRKAMEAFKESGNPVQRAIVLSDWSETAEFMGDRERALELVGKALDIFHAEGSQTRTAEALVRLAGYQVRQNDAAGARSSLRGGLGHLARDPQDDYLARAVDVACDLAVLSDSPKVGARLAGFGQAWRATKGIERPPAHRRRHDERLERVRDALGAESFERECKAGMDLTSDEVLALALEV